MMTVYHEEWTQRVRASLPVSRTASLVRVISCNNRESRLHCPSFERESVLTNTASKYFSIWIPCVFTELCISRAHQDPAGRQAADLLCIKSIDSSS